MEFKINNYVTRNSYNNDTIFKIIDIIDNNYILKGVDIRLFADSPIEDLNLCDYSIEEDKIDDYMYLKMERNNYFYLPGKVLHIDGDKDYLNRCLNQKLKLVQ